MHVGIIAACLPTMKPLFANFFGQMRSLATKGRTTGSNGLNSTPFRSNGYMKQDDMRPGNSFAMKNMSENSSSTGRESDESILDHEVGRGNRRSVLPRGMTIVRTTEVNISR